MKKKILFYYPQHFNRSERGTNPFFDPLLEACDKNGISYDLMEEPDGGTDKPRNPKAKKADTFFWTVTIIRKLLSILFPNKDFYKREKYVAKTLNFLTFNKFKYDKYISISGSMIHLFAELNPKGKVFELQHGVVYKNQLTFFDKKTHQLRKHYQKENLFFLFYGEGFKNSFISNNEKFLNKRIHIIGYPQSKHSETGIQNKIVNYPKNQIIISLQFVDSGDEEYNSSLKELLDNLLAKIYNFDYKIVLKHHPRYNNCIVLDDLISKYPKIEFSTKSTKELSANSILHITPFSTVAFEYAEFGIPTYFPYNQRQPLGKTLFRDDYNYPLYWGEDIAQVLNRLKNQSKWENDSKQVREWYNKFYSPFDEELFLATLKR